MKSFSYVAFSLALLLSIGFAAHANAQSASCVSTGGYNPVSGLSCNGATVAPLGCNNTAGFSSANGTPCNGETPAANGYNGIAVGSNNFLNGCYATMGYSATTGYACNTAINGIVYAGTLGTINVGLPGTDTTPSLTAPGLPTTGDGSNAIVNIALMLALASVAVVASRSGLSYSKN